MPDNYIKKLLCFKSMSLLMSFLIIFQLSAQPDSSGTVVKVVPGKRYEAGAIHRFFLGDGYRNVWTTAVQIPELNLGTFAGGLKPLRRGGGLQTNSLRFQGADGHIYVFRSVDKYPERGYPEMLRGTIIETLGKDEIGLMLPFGSLIVDKLADSLGVLHSKPYYFVMPDDERLGDFRKDFAGMLGSLEVRADEMPDNKPGFAGSAKIIGSDKLSEKLDDNPRNRINAKAFLTARLLDILIGDRDRHADQWRWAGFEDSIGMLWEPVPRDRDFSFVVYDGIVPWLLDRRWAMPGFDGYNRDEPDIYSLTYNARHLDGRLLAGLNWQTWQNTTDAFLEKLNDQLLADAVKSLPPEVYDIVGDQLLGRMKKRRSQMKYLSGIYYKILFKTVNIQTTNEDEIAKIEKMKNGDISLRICPVKEPEFVIYDRVVEQATTDEIRLYLLGGDDRVEISGPGSSNIKLRIIGGKGDDRVTEKESTGNVYFYDTPGDMKIQPESGIKKIAAKKEEAYARPPVGYPESRLTQTLNDVNIHLDPPFDYGYTWMPLQAFGYDKDNGLSIGAGISILKYGFRFDPYSSKQQITAKYASRTGRYEIKYKGVHYDFIRGARLIMNIKTAVPESKPNFFGYGNDTPFDKSLENKNYYRAENNYILSTNELASEFWSGFSAIAGLDYQYLDLNLNKDLRITALIDSGFYNLRTDIRHTISLSAGLEYDSRDNESAPHTGQFSRIILSYFPNALDNKNDFLKLKFTTQLYHSPLKFLTTALRVNGEYLHGSYPYYYAAYLGGEETLRGYNLYRFAGDAALSGSFEARWFIKRVRLIFPSDFGLIGFADAGRVWYDDKSPGGWHKGIGGGFYLAPLLRDYTFSITAARSSEILLFYWNMGFAF